MKTKSVFTGVLLFMLMAIPLSGQQDAKTAVISRPTFETTVNNVELKVWIVTERRELVDTSSTGMGSNVDLERGQVLTDPGIMDLLPMGTHYITINARDTEDDEEIEEAPRVLIVSPSAKTTAVQLRFLRRNYVGSLILDEKGEYEFTFTITANGVSEDIPFKYTVR
jgi:hypothetical protein